MEQKGQNIFWGIYYNRQHAITASLSLTLSKPLSVCSSHPRYELVLHIRNGSNILLFKFKKTQTSLYFAVEGNTQHFWEWGSIGQCPGLEANCYSQALSHDWEIDVLISASAAEEQGVARKQR